MTYLWYGFRYHSRYIETILDIHLSILTNNDYRKYQDPLIKEKGMRITASDLLKVLQMESHALISSNHRYIRDYIIDCHRI